MRFISAEDMGRTMALSWARLPAPKAFCTSTEQALSSSRNST